DITEQRKATEELQRRVTQLSLLNEIGDRIAGLLPPDEVLETAVRLVKDAFDYHQVGVLTVDRENRELVVGALEGAFGGDEPGKLRFSIDEGITGWVARNRQTLLVEDVECDPLYFELFPRPVPTRSELAVPIDGGSDVVGVLDVQSPRSGAFTDADRLTLEIVADQIAVALENARLYDALQNELVQRRTAEDSLRRNIQRMEILRDIDQAILGAKSMQEVAESALRHLRRLVPCQRAAIDLFDRESGEVVVLAADQDTTDGVAASGARFPLTDWAYTERLPAGSGHLYIRDIAELPQSAPLVQAARDVGLRSYLAAPIRASGQLIGVLGLGVDRLAGFDPEHGPIVQEVADSVAVAIQQARLLDSLREQGERIRDAMVRLGEAEEAERRRVVRVLHDRVGQNLTALDLNLSLVRSRLAERDLTELCSRIESSLSLVEETNEQIRRIMSDIRPSVLDDYGLLAALRWYAGTFSSRTGIGVTVLDHLHDQRNLPTPVENALFRIAQEALYNTAKHAQASEVIIDLSERAAAIRLAISDDGVGFDSKDEHTARNSWGLLTMRERAESIGAQCVVDSVPDQGTRVTVDVPL
ncbi:MAG: GAF domain-containing sensor histidine kinase, partial [Anaerolineae bacterium]